MRVTRFTCCSESFVVLSIPLHEPSSTDSLTHSERDIARRILRGDSNAEIAAARGTSVRTVANQVRAIFAKLHVCSRAELVARIARPSAGQDHIADDAGTPGMPGRPNEPQR
jgi:DNA-binding CsgD family transcriptional regulator